MKTIAQKQKIKKELSRLVDLSIDLLPEHHLHVDISAHVKSVRVYLYVNGWKQNKDYDKTWYFYYESTVGLAKQVSSIIKETKQKIQELS